MGLSGLGQDGALCFAAVAALVDPVFVFVTKALPAFGAGVLNSRPLVQFLRVGWEQCC